MPQAKQSKPQGPAVLTKTAISAIGSELGEALAMLKADSLNQDQTELFLSHLHLVQQITNNYVSHAYRSGRIPAPGGFYPPHGGMGMPNTYPMHQPMQSMMNPMYHNAGVSQVLHGHQAAMPANYHAPTAINLSQGLGDTANGELIRREMSAEVYSGDIRCEVTFLQDPMHREGTILPRLFYTKRDDSNAAYLISDFLTNGQFVLRNLNEEWRNHLADLRRVTTMIRLVVGNLCPTLHLWGGGMNDVQALLTRSFESVPVVKLEVTSEKDILDTIDLSSNVSGFNDSQMSPAEGQSPILSITSVSNGLGFTVISNIPVADYNESNIWIMDMDKNILGSMSMEGCVLRFEYTSSELSAKGLSLEALHELLKDWRMVALSAPNFNEQTRDELIGRNIVLPPFLTYGEVPCKVDVVFKGEPQAVILSV